MKKIKQTLTTSRSPDFDASSNCNSRSVIFGDKTILSFSHAKIFLNLIPFN